MTQNTLPPLTAFVQASTNRSFVLRPSVASIWKEQWPTERIGDILVSECPGSIDGSVFIYWLGDRSVYSPDVRNWIQEHLEDHDAVRICYVPELPDDVHSSLKGDLAELKAKTAAGPADPKTEAIAWADAYLNNAGLTSYTDLVKAHSQASVSAGAEATETFAWAALAENGNVIIWSRRRDTVDPVAAKYGRPVVPVIALDIRPAAANRVGANGRAPPLQHFNHTSRQASSSWLSLHHRKQGQHIMKKAIAYIIVALATVTTLQAKAKDVTANIVNVTPVYSDRTQQTQVCDVISGDQQQQSAVNPGSVIGGIAGALLGGQVGNGNGRVAMAALGAVTGALAGDRVAQRTSQPQQVCRWIQRVEQQVSGYRVVYAYEGETYETVLPYDPSRGGSVTTVNVKMSLSVR